MLPDPKIKCPATGFAKSCLQIVSRHTCPKFVSLKGKDPQSGEHIESWGCVDTFLPKLLLENAQMSRHVAASVDKFRNAVTEAERDKQALLAQFTGNRDLKVVK